MGVYVSALELFSIGIGPSRSHTVGPMRAGLDFRQRLARAGLLDRVTRFSCRLEGSLAATGVGHGTPDAVIAGLRGYEPETVPPGDVHGTWERLGDGETTAIDGVPFAAADMMFAPISVRGRHPNTLVLTAEVAGAAPVRETYYSVGGGFIRREGEDDDAESAAAPATPGAPAPSSSSTSSYSNMTQLLALARERNCSIADIAWADELALHGGDAAAVTAGLDAIWAAMRSCVEHGLHTDGVLPGGLNGRRRAGARSPSEAWRATPATRCPCTRSR